MPISSPSYFPPQNGNRSIVGQTAGLQMLGARCFLGGQNAAKFTTVNDLVVIGDNALSAGIQGARITDAFFAGSVILGSNAGATMTRATNNANGRAGNILIGKDAAAAAVSGDSLVVIGDGALRSFVGAPAAAGPNRSVFIGCNAGGGLTGVGQLDGITVIGYGAFGGSTTVHTNSVNSVVIGNSAVAQVQTGLSGCVFIGTQAGFQAGVTNQSGQNTVIGAGAGGSLDMGDDNTLIGNTAVVSDNGFGNQDENVVVGSGSSVFGSQGVVVGKGATAGQFGTSTRGHIVIGYRAGVLLPNNLTDVLYIGTFNAGSSGVERCAIYGRMDKGALILGLSQQGVDRDIGAADASNLVKLVNGTYGAAPVAPVGGGQFASIAGQLNWLATTGKITPLTTPGYTFATLPAANAARIGDRTYITDGAAAPAFGAVAAGGGAVVTPVFCDGANWINA